MSGSHPVFTTHSLVCVTVTLLTNPPDVIELEGLHFYARISQPAGKAPNVKVVLQQGHRRTRRWNAL